MRQGGFTFLSPLTHSTVSVFRSGFLGVSVNSLCPVPVKTWQSLYSLCLSPNRATDRMCMAQLMGEWAWVSS